MIDELVHLSKEVTRIMEWVQERTVVRPQVVVLRAIRFFVVHSMLMELYLSLVALTTLLGYI
jgi:hypothetical protein